MKKKTSLVFVVLCLVIISVFTIGCGSSGSTSTSTPTTSTASKCQFKDSDGNRSCTNEATHGQLCDYHFNMLNDTYNSMTE